MRSRSKRLACLWSGAERNIRVGGSVIFGEDLVGYRIVPGKSGRRDRMLRETRRRKWKEGERNDGGRKEGKGEGLERRDQGNLEELIAHGQKVSFLPVKLSRKARMR
eukprot:762807-Hanusia_phi.AAC.1